MGKRRYPSFSNTSKRRGIPFSSAGYSPDFPAEALAARLEPATPFLAPDLPALPLFEWVLAELSEADAPLDFPLPAPLSSAGEDSSTAATRDADADGVFAAAGGGTGGADPVCDKARATP